MPISFRSVAFLLVFIAACSSESLATGAGGAGEKQTETAASTQKKSETPVKKAPINNYLLYLNAKNTQNMPEAEKFLKKALEQDADNALLKSEYFSVLTLNGHSDEAYPYAVDEYKRDPESLLAMLVQVVVLTKRKEYAAAMDVLDSFKGKASMSFLTPLFRAWLLFGDGKTEKAFKFLEKVNTADTAALYEFHAALMHDLKGHAEETEKHYRGLMEKNQGLSLRASQTYGNFLLRNERYDRFNDLLAAYRAGERSFPLTGETFFLAGGKKIGKDIPSYVPTAREGLAEAFFDVAGSLADRGSPESAFFFTQMALDLDPSLSLARVLKGMLLERLSRLDEAEALYRAESEDSDIYFSSQVSLIRLLTDLERYDKAEKAVKNLVKKAPESSVAHMEAGDTFRLAKKYAEAIKAYTQAIRLSDPKQNLLWSMYYNRGRSYERNNQWELGEKDLLQAILLKPDQPDVLNYLAYSWLERGKNVNEARRMLERAAVKSPANGLIADSLGWAYFLTKEYQKAVAVLELAIQILPDNATVNDHLGDAYWRIGRKREAGFQWERALTFDAKLTDADKNRLKTKIREGLPEDEAPVKPEKTANVKKTAARQPSDVKK